jgi:hypothetical protein
MFTQARWSLSALLLALLLPRGAAAGDFIDTRISFTLGDDNFYKNAGEQVPDSPRIGIGDREGYELPFDNLDLATTGRENELHLVLYKKVGGILPGLITEAAAAMEVDLAALEEGQSVDRVFSDDSSYIRLIYAIDPGRKGDRYLDVVLFPLSGDRFRVGYLYDLTWGGADMFPRKKGLSPAFKLGGNHGILYWWGGMKMVLAETALDESANLQGLTLETSENETLYSALFGVGTEPIPGLSIDLSGGYVQMARNPIKDVANELVTATGFSARLAYGQGLSVGLSSDLRLLRNDVEFLESLSRRPTYGSGLSWRVALEGNAIVQTLADPDLYAATTRQWASAGALDVRMQYDRLRVNLTAVYRSLQFSLLNTPSFVPFTAFNEDAIVQPQIFGAVAADYFFERWSLMPGIQAGVEMPASVKTEVFASIGNAPPSLVGVFDVLVRTTGERIILPAGEERVPIYSARITTRWYPSEMLTLLAFLIIAYDENSTRLEINADLTKSRVFQDPFILGAGVTAQARF